MFVQLTPVMPVHLPAMHLSAPVSAFPSLQDVPLIRSVQTSAQHAVVVQVPAAALHASAERSLVFGAEVHFTPARPQVVEVQAGHEGPPQSMPVSYPFRTPSVHVGHAGQVGPPQSTPSRWEDSQDESRNDEMFHGTG